MIASVACVATKANHQILSIWLKRPTSRVCSLQPFGWHGLRQRELDYPATAAEPVAQREATAALSHGMDPLVQSHCYFPFTFSPSAIVPA